MQQIHQALKNNLMDLLHDDKRRLIYSVVNMNKIIIGLWIAMIALLLWANYSPVNAQMFPGRGDIFFINGEIKQHHETYFRAWRFVVVVIQPLLPWTDDDSPHRPAPLWPRCNRTRMTPI